MSHTYELLAGLLDYPEEDWGERLAACREHTDATMERIRSALDGFASDVEHLALPALQERYAQTFDLDPAAALEVGHHLFGDSYRRGLFLARLKETEDQCGIDAQRQLPDHLPVLLRLLPRLDDADLRSSLLTSCMLPALDAIERALAGRGNPYARLVTAVRHAIAQEEGGAPRPS